MSAPRFDIAVVGAGFAGLACAEAAARRGKRVVVLERKRDVGAGIHTTGLLTQEALLAVRAPPRVLGGRTDALEVCTRRGVVTRLSRPGAGFVSTDTAELLRLLADRAVAGGADIRVGVTVAGVTQGSGGVRVHASGGDVLAAHVVACDGTRSRVARGAGLEAPRRVLVGAEHHVELEAGHGLDPDACLLLVDWAVAPGYAAWCVRGARGTWQVGLLGSAAGGWRPDTALGAFFAWLAATRGARVRRVVEVRGGLVPAGGAVARPWSGRVALAGDAAGHASALTAGGIGRATLAGRAMGEGLGEPGEPWRAELLRIGKACGGWRLVAAHALGATARLGAAGFALALGGGPFRDPVADLAFRPTFGRGRTRPPAPAAAGR